MRIPIRQPIRIATRDERNSRRSGYPASLYAGAWLNRLAPDSAGLIADERSGLGDVRPLQSGIAKTFDGTTQYATISNQALANQMTVCWWAKRSSTSTVDIIVGAGAGGDLKKFGYNSKPTELFFRFLTDSTTPDHGVDATQWHFISARRNLDNTCDFSVNGGAWTQLYSGVAQPGSIDIGRIALDQSVGYHAGQIYDLRIYDKALTTSENQHVHTFGQSGANPTTTNLIGQWKMEGNFLDSSGNAAHATGVNSPTDYTGSDVPYSYLNNVGYTASPDLIPRDESDTTLDTTGNPLQFKGICPAKAQIEDSSCLTMDGATMSISVPSLVGSETVVSSGGTSTPSIAAGVINFTAGTCWDLILSNGMTFPLADGSTANQGVRTVTDRDTEAAYTITNGADSCWAATQDLYHSNILNGFSWSGVAGQPFVPPSLSDPTVDAIAGLPLTNPAGAWHNDAESTINFCENPAAPVFFGKDVPGDGVLAKYSFDGAPGDVAIGINQTTKEGRFTLLQ